VGVGLLVVKVQSFGGGVQSVAMLRMAIAGDIERPDLVIFGDTMAEPSGVYETIERERANAEANGIPFVTVAWDNLAAPRSGLLYAPLYTVNTEPYWKPPRAGCAPCEDCDWQGIPATLGYWILPGEKFGQLLRSCTDKFKIAPIRRHLRSLGATKAELWLGMTTDESVRVKPSPLKWITHRWPLIEKSLSRGDCEAYLSRLGLRVAKSACVFCPYRSDASWLQVKANAHDWEAAIAYDESIRDKRPGFKTYVHSSRKPLKEVVLKNDGAPSLFMDECFGVCAS
jgi:hypothetical protein